MFYVIINTVLFIIAATIYRYSKKLETEDTVFFARVASGVVAGIGSILLIYSTLVTVPAGHVKVATLFGKVQDDTYSEGFHIVNPLLSFEEYDLREKTYFLEKVGVPSEDKLITTFDVSVQYRINGALARTMLSEVGGVKDALEVHMVPKLRSVLREQGKGVKKAEDFFNEQVQIKLQTTLQESMVAFLSPKGIQVSAVLIRNVLPPQFITDAIVATKQREQEVLKQEAELERFAKEQEQKVKQAVAENDAAKLHAEKVKTLADAEAYRVKAEYIGRAEGIQKLKLQLTPEYIEYLRAQKWNGVLPVYAGGENIPMIDMRK